MPQDITIQRQIFELQVPKSMNRQRLEGRVRSLYEQQIMPCLQEIAAQWADQEHVLQIETVALDFGTIHQSDLSEEFPRRFAHLWREQFGGWGRLPRTALDSGTRTIEAAAAQLEELAHFFATGTVPWWMSPSGGGSLEKNLRKLVATVPDAVLTMLQAGLSQESFRRRLARQVSWSTVQAIGELLIQRQERAEFSAWLTFFDQLLSLGFADRPQISRRIVLAEVLLEYGSAGSVRWEVKEFSRQLLRRLVKESGCSSRELGERLARATRQMKSLASAKDQALSDVFAAINTEFFALESRSEPHQHSFQLAQELQSLWRSLPSLPPALWAITWEQATWEATLLKLLATAPNEVRVLLRTGLAQARFRECLAREVSWSTLLAIAECLAVSGTTASMKDWLRFWDQVLSLALAYQSPGLGRRVVSELLLECFAMDSWRWEATDFNRRLIRHLVEQGGWSVGELNDRLGTAGEQINAPCLVKNRELAQLMATMATEGTDDSRLSVSTDAPRKALWQADQDAIYVANAGLVLLAPYLPRLGEKLGWIHQEQWVDPAAQERAVHLLQYLVNGQEECWEHELVLNKVLCGWKLAEPVNRELCLTPEEKSEGEQLLTDVVIHWAALKNISNKGLQTSFLQREGRLLHEPPYWTLTVEEKSYDMLLSQLPWSISFIKLPWMPQALQVAWG